MTASGAPSVNGTPQVGETLTADTTGISDGNGLDRVQFRFQWVSNDGSQDTDIASATGSNYTLSANDEGRTIKVRATFTDRGGYAELLTSSATAEATYNSAATGAPRVVGVGRVGNTLTVDTFRIADANGLVNVFYSYQWISNDGSSDTDIEGATGSSYTLVAADGGNKIKVRVSFTDDAGYDETLTSAAFGRVTSIRPTGSVSSITVEVTADRYHREANNVMTSSSSPGPMSTIAPPTTTLTCIIVGGVDPSGPGC